MENKLVIRNVPVGYGCPQGLLKDHYAFASPDLEKVGATLVIQKDRGVYDLDQHGTEIRLLIVLATGDDFVEVVERDRVHDLLHELLGRPALILAKLVIIVLILHLYHFCIFHRQLL